MTRLLRMTPLIPMTSLSFTDCNILTDRLQLWRSDRRVGQDTRTQTERTQEWSLPGHRDSARAARPGAGGSIPGGSVSCVSVSEARQAHTGLAATPSPVMSIFIFISF